MLTKLLPEVNYLMSPAASSLGIKNIGQISIIVHDLQRATAFYRDTLGLPLLFTAPNLAFFDCGGVRLMLGPAETPDLHAAPQRLVDAGVQVVAPPLLIAPLPAYDLWMNAFRDSEGNIMELMSEVPRVA